MANTISDSEIARRIHELQTQYGPGSVMPPPQLQKAVVQKKELTLPAGQDYTINLSKVENGYIVSVVRAGVSGTAVRYVATEVKEIVELAVAAIVSNRLDAVS